MTDKPQASPRRRRVGSVVKTVPRLNTSVRNAMFRALEESGLGHDDFEVGPLSFEQPAVRDKEAIAGQIIHHRRGRHYFLVARVARPRATGDATKNLVAMSHMIGAWHYYVVASVLPENPHSHTGHLKQEELLPTFKQWLASVKVEEAEPDLWDLARKSSSVLTPTDEPDNTQFSTEEQRKVDQALDEFAKEVELKRLMPPEQLKALQHQVPHWKALARRLGRVDWFDKFTGALIKQVASKVLTKANAEALWQLGVKTVEWIASHLRQLPPG
jgi:hypothetical protein